jgi:hypothetical protein
MLKVASTTMDAPIDTVPDANPEEVVDATVTKIATEKLSVSDGFDGTSGVHGRTSDDGE